MRSFRPTFFLCALLLALSAVLSACSATPQQKLYALNGTYTAAVTSLASDIDAGLITDPAVLHDIRTAIVEADAELDAAKTAADAGNPLDADYALQRAALAADKVLLLKSQEQAQREKTNGTR